jgi:acetate kinase
MDSIAVINAGLSSIKFSLFAASNDELALAAGATPGACRPVTERNPT